MDLVKIEDKNLAQIFTVDGIEGIINQIKLKVADFEPDLETAGSRKEIASMAYKVSQSKTHVEKFGKKLSTTLKADAKKVDAARKHFRDSMDDLRDEVRQPLTEWETIEKERLEAEALAHEIAEDHGEALAMEEMFERERVVARKEAEFAKQEEDRREKAEAERLKKERQDQIERDATALAQKQIDDAARREREAKESIARAERDKKEAAEKAERDRIVVAKQVEQEKIEAAEIAEREKKAAIARIKEDIAAKERKHLADEKANKEKADRLARHNTHRIKIEREAIEDIESSVPVPVDAITIVEAISAGKIRNVVINY